MDQPHAGEQEDSFTHSCQANCDTRWVSDPANPHDSNTGAIRKGDTIWLQAQPFGSGPAWQPARLADNTPCYIRPHDFK